MRVLGVQELWFIDPDLRTVMIHRFSSDGVEKIQQVNEEDTLATDLRPRFNLVLK